MNYISSGMKIIHVTPTWEKLLIGSQITITTVFAISMVMLLITWNEKYIDKIILKRKEQK